MKSGVSKKEEDTVVVRLNGQAYVRVPRIYNMQRIVKINNVWVKIDSSNKVSGFIKFSRKLYDCGYASKTCLQELGLM